MTKIDGINGIIEVLRRKIGNSTRKAEGGKTAGNEKAVGTRTARLSTRELRHGIKNRIRALNRKDDDYREQASHIFLESTLLWEFGDEIAQDQNFSELIENINQALRANSEINNNLDKLLDDLAGD